MKTWFEYSSSHSMNVSIIGTFDNPNSAKDALDIVEDFTMAFYDERYPSIKEFENKWEEKYPFIKYRLLEGEMNIGIDNDPNIEVDGNQINITRLRHDNIGGIIKVLMTTGAINIEVKP